MIINSLIQKSSSTNLITFYLVEADGSTGVIYGTYHAEKVLRNLIQRDWPCLRVGPFLFISMEVLNAHRHRTIIQQFFNMISLVILLLNINLLGKPGNKRVLVIQQLD